MKYKKLFLGVISTIIVCGIAKAQGTRPGKDTRELMTEIKKVTYKESLVKGRICQRELD